ASCAIGPFVRLFDARFTLDDVRKMDVALTVEGEDGFRLDGVSSIRLISRDPEDLVRQTIGDVHQYPDGFVLFLGTMFAPTKDRDGAGQGFTHKSGDVVTVASPRLGKLVNRMRTSDTCEPWSFGVGALMQNLARLARLTRARCLRSIEKAMAQQVGARSNDRDQHKRAEGLGCDLIARMSSDRHAEPDR